MKILMIPSLYKPYSRGGAEVVFNRVLDELKKEHTISVLTIAPWNGFCSLSPKVTEEDGVHVYRFYPLNVFSFIYIIGKPTLLRLVWHIIDMFNIHSYFVARSVIKQVKPDVVMTHNIKGVGYMIPRAIRSMRVPHVHTLQDVQLSNPTGFILFGEEQSLKNENILVRIYEAVNRFLFGSPDMIVFASRYLHDFYTARNFFIQSKKIINPNLLPNFLVRVASEGKEKKEPIVFGYVGQLERAKGILFLVESFKKWRPSTPVKLLIIGRGSWEEDVRTIIVNDPRISFIGFVPNERLGEYLRSMHYVIIPSLCYENSPVILFESFAVGTPVIVANIGGAAEMIEDRKNGFIFRPGDHVSLTEALERANERCDYRGLSLSAGKTVSGYDVKTYCITLLSFIEKLK